MIFEYITYLLLLNIWSESGVKAELEIQPALSDLSDRALIQTSQGTAYPRNENYDIIEDGNWGDWMEPIEGPEGYLACGIAIRNEANQLLGDDTANNAIKLIFCQINSWKTQTSLLLNEGLWGSWGDDKLCPENTFIHGARPKTEQPAGSSDDTSLNGIEIRCKNPKIENASSTNVEVAPGGWGVWGAWVVHDNDYVCGGQVRFDPKHGASEDDTALNGVSFKFCTFDYKYPDYSSVEEGNWGSWKVPVEGPYEYLACGMIVKNHPDQGNSDDTGLNGIKLIYCHTYNWGIQSEVVVIEGSYGDWQPKMMCDTGYFINAISTKNLGMQGSNSDDYSMTGIKFTCSSPENPSKISSHDFGANNLGTWGLFKVFDESYLCGVQVRYDYTVLGSDATSLNGLRVKSCAYKYDLADYVLVHQGVFGDWVKPIKGNDGYYACGLAVKAQSYLGPQIGKDDTMINAVKIVYCLYNDWSSKYESVLNAGDYGTWMNSMMCPQNTFIHAARAKVEKSQNNEGPNADDTAMNSIEIKCKSPKPGSTSTVVSLEYGQFGDWGDWVEFDKFVCGGQSRYDTTKYGSDASGLNGLKFKFCSYTYTGPIYEPVSNGLFGDWLKTVDAPDDFFGCGATLRVQSSQGDGDDTAANAIRLTYCNKFDWNTQLDSNLNEGLYGEWKTKVMCPKGQFMNGANIKLEKSQGIYSDDTAMNGLKIKCTLPTAAAQNSEVMVEEGKWGDWQQWLINTDLFVCGGQVRFDSTLSGSDATALNGLALKFCKIQYDTTGYIPIEETNQGYWLNPVKGPEGQYACGIALRSHAYQGKGSDDSMVNAVKLIYCTYGTWSFQSNTLLNDGMYGDWQDVKMCPKNTYIHAARAKVDVTEEITEDNTPFNGIEIKCKNPMPGSTSTVVTAEYGQFGQWKSWVEYDQFVCGGQVKFDFTELGPDKSLYQDASGMNGLKLKFCPYIFNGPYYQVIVEGFWGDWLSTVKAPQDHLACGMAVRFHEIQNSLDDSALNAFKIVYCKMNNWDTQQVLTLNEGLYGDWQAAVMCPRDSYINAVSARIESYQGTSSDDTAFNGLKFKCSNPKVTQNSELTLTEGYWGDWGEWVSNTGSYICAGQVRFDNTSLGQDATALNGLALKFCKFKYDVSEYLVVDNGIRGDWLNPVEVSAGYYACGIALRHQGVQGSSSDDTETNAIKIIYCLYSDWNSKIEINLNEGLYGDWKAPVMCDKDTYIHAARARVEPDQGTGDDTGLNDIEIKCKSAKPGSQSTVMTLKYGGSLGNYGDWVEQDKFVCGGQVRFDSTTLGNDATALNGLKLKFCPYSYSTPIYEVIEEGSLGNWFNSVEAPEKHLGCGIALRYNKDKSSKGNFPVDSVKVIYCSASNWETQSEQVTNDGLSGNWKNKVMCLKGSFIHTSRAKLEPINGPFGDELVFSGLEFKCKDVQSSTESSGYLVDNGGWGTWQKWIKHDERYVCGATARFDSNTESKNGSGVFGLGFNFCKLPKS